MKYRFLGKPDRMFPALKTDKVYDLEVIVRGSLFLRGSPIITYPISCPYSSWETFYENWEPVTEESKPTSDRGRGELPIVDNNYSLSPAEVRPMIERLNNRSGVKGSDTLSGVRELVREYRNKLNEVIDRLNSMEEGK